MSELMSEAEIWAEKEHRIETRLGILFGDLKPTLIGLYMAQEEADDWERSYRRQCQNTELTDRRGAGSVK